MQLMIEENDISQQVPGFDGGLWCWRIELSLDGRSRELFYRRSIAAVHHCTGEHLANFIHACYSRQPELAAES